MKGYIAYNLTDVCRAEILGRFAPKFANVIVHHITHSFNVSHEDALPPMPVSAKVIGYASNEKIEALVVEIDGTSIRGDGKLMHITLSHTPEAKPVMSNDLLSSQGFEPCEHFTIEVIPTFNAF